MSNVAKPRCAGMIPTAGGVYRRCRKRPWDCQHPINEVRSSARAIVPDRRTGPYGKSLELASIVTDPIVRVIHHSNGEPYVRGDR